MDLFDSAIFDEVIFDTGAPATTPTTGISGHRVPVQIVPDPADDEDAALIVALLRHRLRV